MTNRIELNWDVPYAVDEQRYYCSETPIDIENLPEPKAILAGDVRSYVDYAGDFDKKYYIRVGLVKDTVEKISEEIEVVFGNVWNPSNLLNKPKLWIDCENVTADSFDRISQVTDISDSGYNFTQPIDNQKPIHVFETSLNRKVILFDGNDDNLVNLNAQAIARNISKFWSFVVYKKKSTDNTGQFRNILQFNRGDSSGANSRISVYAGFSTDANVGAIYVRPTDGVTSAVGITGAVKSQVWTSLFSQWDGESAQMSLSQDGVFNSISASGVATTTSNTAPSVTPATIGCGAAGTGVSKDSFADVYLACLIVGSGSLPTVEERKKLEGWAAHKYGLTDNLPADHPYKESIVKGYTDFILQNSTIVERDSLNLDFIGN